MSELSYTYDAVGNRTGQVEAGGAVTTWTYDEVGQLIGEQRAGGDEEGFDIQYQYDGAGNRTLRTADGVTTTYTYSPANRLQTAVSPDGVTTYTHDKAGNRKQVNYPGSGGISYFAYDAAGRMTQAETPGSAGPVTLTYNADGQRVRKETAGGDLTQYLYDFNNLLQEFDGDDDPVRSYTATDDEYGDLLSEYDELDDTGTPGEGEFYRQFDAQANLEAMTDDAGSITQKFKFQAFGLPASSGQTGWANLTAQDWSTMSPADWSRLPVNPSSRLAWGGQKQYYLDPETELYLLGMGSTGGTSGGGRYYDPETGRFLSEDRVRYGAGDNNLFRYVGNDPINKNDPSGKQTPEDERKARAAAAAAGTAPVAPAPLMGTDLSPMPGPMRYSTGGRSSTLAQPSPLPNPPRQEAFGDAPEIDISASQLNKYSRPGPTLAELQRNQPLSNPPTPLSEPDAKKINAWITIGLHSLNDRGLSRRPDRAQIATALLKQQGYGDADIPDEVRGNKWQYKPTDTHGDPNYGFMADIAMQTIEQAAAERVKASPNYSTMTAQQKQHQLLNHMENMGLNRDVAARLTNIDFTKGVVASALANVVKPVGELGESITGGVYPQGATRTNLENRGDLLATYNPDEFWTRGFQLPGRVASAVTMLNPVGLTLATLEGAAGGRYAAARMGAGEGGQATMAAVSGASMLALGKLTQSLGPGGNWLSRPIAAALLKAGAGEAIPYYISRAVAGALQSRAMGLIGQLTADQINNVLGLQYQGIWNSIKSNLSSSDQTLSDMAFGIVGGLSANPSFLIWAGKYKGWDREQLWTAIKNAQTLQKGAESAELTTTKDIRTVATSTKGRVVGLEDNIKSIESLLKKLKGTSADKIYDALRYTITYSADRFANGARNTLDALGTMGYRVVEIKNTFGPHQAYKGVNVKLITPDGVQCELQFHTPESYALKQRMHGTYEKFNMLPEGSEKQELARRMIEQSSSIADPPGADTIHN